MITYTVHERDSDLTDISKRAESILFVKEGFAWMAFLFPLLWLIYHRMWIVLAGFVAILALLEVGVVSLELAEEIAVVTTFAMSGLFALQANDLRRWSLARRSYQFVELVSGRDRGECEQKFFTQWLDGQGAQADVLPKRAMSAKPAPAATGKTSSGGDDVIGLFPEPGK